MNTNRIPDIIIGRLPVYLRALQQLSERGILTTSSQELGEIIGISAAQIRKDISQFGEFGKQGTGYSIPFLIERLRDILKVDRVWEVVIVGMGDIGHALARYNGFANRGFHISMLFDKSFLTKFTQRNSFAVSCTKFFYSKFFIYIYSNKIFPLRFSSPNCS